MELKILRELPGNLWSAVVMELFERLAYYGMVLVLGIYVVDHMGIPADVYGVVYGLFTATLYFLPVVALGILVWSLGEMTCSARFFQYCGTIAPPDQVAVYLGYSFFAIFIGNLYSGPFAGWLYENYIRLPHLAGEAIQPWVFFGGVMLMGVFSTIGLALYGRFVAAPPETAGD